MNHEKIINFIKINFPEKIILDISNYPIEKIFIYINKLSDNNNKVIFILENEQILKTMKEMNNLISLNDKIILIFGGDIITFNENKNDDKILKLVKKIIEKGEDYNLCYICYEEEKTGWRCGECGNFICNECFNKLKKYKCGYCRNEFYKIKIKNLL